jgi:hypothetical protein
MEFAHNDIRLKKQCMQTSPQDPFTGCNSQKENNPGGIIFLKYKCIFHKRIVLSSSAAEILLHNVIDFRCVTTVQTLQRTQPTVFLTFLQMNISEKPFFFLV